MFRPRQSTPRSSPLGTSTVEFSPNPVALPANWDSGTISVDANTMSSIAQAVLASSTNINDYLGDIINSLNSLPLSWTGVSPALADEFYARWSAATTALSGTPGDPNAGILNAITPGLAEAAENYAKVGAFSKVAQAVAQASVNYGEAEDGNKQMFQSRTTSLNAPPGDLPPPARSESQGPVTETAPAPP